MTSVDPSGSFSTERSLDERARHILMSGEVHKIDLRNRVARKITNLFVCQNVFLLLLLCIFGYCDVRFTQKVLARDVSWQAYEAAAKTRFVTPNVLITLIAGTITEVATLTAAITYYLFHDPTGRTRSSHVRRGKRAKGDVQQG